MRIIAGRLGGRNFQSPRGHKTHPMSDKGRGALFNALGDIAGLTVLDAFAGSGALSYEAVSRGAAQALAIERDRTAQQAIETNIKKLGLQGQVKLVNASANAWLSTTDKHFDLVLLDPPFEDLQINLLSKLAERTKPGGVVVFSLPPAAKIELKADYQRLSAKSYGDNQLVFYRRIS
jgi:16S rRNA (guanine966-N2)-methyltransferase